MLIHLARPPKPDIEDILQMKDDYVNWHARRISQHKQDQTFFDLTFDVPAPSSRDQLIVPTGNRLVGQVISHLIAEIPVINVLPRNQDESAIKRSGKQTGWINGFWAKIDLASILYDMLWFDSVRGCHVARLLHDPTAWPLRPEPPEKPHEPPDIVEAPEGEFIQYIEEVAAYDEEMATYREDLEEYKDYTEEHLPIRVDMLDPLGCFWEPTDDPQKIIISYEKTVAQIVADYPKAADELDGMDPSTKLTWNEYWDEKYKAYWLSGYSLRTQGGPINHPHISEREDWLLEPTPHGFGFFPFEIDGPWKTPSVESDKRYPSIYFPIRSVLRYESTLATMIAHIIRAHGWAPLVVTTDRSDADKPIINMSPGFHNYLQSDESAKFLEFGGQTLTSLEKLIGFMEEYVSEGSGLADVLQGKTKGRSGYQQSQLASMARIALVPIELSVKRFIEKASRYVFKLVRYVDEPVVILGGDSFDDNELVMRPEDARRLGQIKVQMKTVLPIDESAKIGNYLNLNKAGMLSAATAARLIGIENSEDEHARWSAEQIASQKEFIDALGQLYAKEHWGELFDFLQNQQQQAVSAGQQGGPPGGTSTPGGPPRQPAGPGGAREAGQVSRQARQGGQPPKRLGRGGGGEDSAYDLSTSA